jgi:Uma2 family endonuclease
VVLAQPGLTLEQFLQLPERKPALEYEDGVVTQKVSPKFRHSKLQFALASRLEAAARPRAIHVLPEIRFSVQGRSYVPDIGVYLWDRVPAPPDGDFEDDLFIAPDIAVEILSPKQSTTAAIRRCHWYVANGAKIAMLVDPDDRTVLVVRPGGATLVVRGDEPIDITEILPAFRLTPAELFASLRPA